MAVVILMYHHIASDTGDDAVDPVYDVPLAAFTEQMRLLHASGIPVVGLDELYDKKRIPENGVVITFDDGYSSWANRALPILKQYDFGAEFFVTGNLIGQSGHVTWPELEQLRDAGMGIGSHAMHHRFLDELSPSEVATELSESRSLLTQRLGTAVDYFAPPGGRLGVVERAAKKAGYRGVCTSREGVVRDGAPPFLLNRIAVRNGLSQDAFAALVARRTWPILSRRTHQVIREGVRQGLGHHAYERLRATLIKRRHRG